MTALVRRIRFVRVAAAASTTAGDEMTKSGAVMLADPEDVETDLVRQLDLLDQVGQSLLDADRAAVARILGDLAEGVDADLHRRIMADPE